MRRIVFLMFLSAAGCIGLPKHVEPPIAEPVEGAVDSLALAADCLDRGDAAAAVPHLTEHVRRFPDQMVIRSMLAEQLLTLGKTREAKVEFERSAELYRSDVPKHRDALVQCHTRLMQIAQAEEDGFAEPYHRGAGLVLVVDGWGKPDRDATAGEQTLSKALANLREAAERNPSDGRVQFLLGETLALLGQSSAARTAYRKALAAPPAVLTANERERAEEMR